MDPEERLQRRREQYRLRRDRETPEEAERRRRRNRDYMRRRRAAMTAEQRRAERARTTQLTTPQPSQQTPCNRVVPSFDDPAIIRKMCEFHNSLFSLESSSCSVCIERFPSKSVDVMNVCRRCTNDKHIPKLYSADNNMDPGPVPPELTVSVANAIAYRIYLFRQLNTAISFNILHISEGTSCLTLLPIYCIA